MNKKKLRNERKNGERGRERRNERRKGKKRKKLPSTILRSGGFFVVRKRVLEGKDFTFVDEIRFKCFLI